MKSTYRHALCLSLLSAVACLSAAACLDPGDGENESTQDPDEADLGVATDALGFPRRISYFPGKVNAHIDPNGLWVKDPDCSSGSNINPLTYCQQWYPDTVSAIPVALSTKPANLWNTAGCGAQSSGNGTSEWSCEPAPRRISYWGGKVNAHVDPSGGWVKDPDCSSGSGILPLTYCKEWYPDTMSATPVALSSKPNGLWNTAGCVSQHDGDGVNEWTCDPAPRISYFPGKVNLHRDPGGQWIKDADCSSGAQIDPLQYCREFYPATVSVTAVAPTSKPKLAWNTAGCGAQYSGDGTKEYICNQ